MKITINSKELTIDTKSNTFTGAKQLDYLGIKFKVVIKKTKSLRIKQNKLLMVMQLKLFDL